MDEKWKSKYIYKKKNEIQEQTEWCRTGGKGENWHENHQTNFAFKFRFVQLAWLENGESRGQSLPSLNRIHRMSINTFRSRWSNARFRYAWFVANALVRSFQNDRGIENEVRPQSVATSKLEAGEPIPESNNAVLHQRVSWHAKLVQIFTVIPNDSPSSFKHFKRFFFSRRNLSIKFRSVKPSSSLVPVNRFYSV